MIWTVVRIYVDAEVLYLVEDFLNLLQICILFLSLTPEMFLIKVYGNMCFYILRIRKRNYLWSIYFLNLHFHPFILILNRQATNN